jgi:hypothetical protein
MTERLPSASVDPSLLSPEQRARAVAVLLATGLVRLGSSLVSPTSPPPEAPENLPGSDPNRLALSGTTSVTVTAG